MLQTKFTELLGCTVPLQQAGMGKLASPALAAAVADAGGLGMVSGIGAAPPEYVAKILDGLRRSTSGAFGANFIVDGVELARLPHAVDDEVRAERAGRRPTQAVENLCDVLWRRGSDPADHSQSSGV